MKILTHWLRAYLPTLPVSDRQLADDLTLRGIAVEGVHDLGLNAAGQPNGHLFEMDITTNRVDAMNHYGIAREAATIYDLPLTPLEPAQDPGASASSIPSGRVGSSAKASAPTSFPVRIDPAAQHLCGRFTARVLSDVTIAPSTGPVNTFFELLGQRLISNAVDASNFTLLGMGHPTHAFDLDKIEGGIVVRLAHPGERLKLLDGSERTLDPDDLVIADERRAISLAGVMGGWETMITPNTRNVLVESAWFAPASIRRSSRRHNLHTDASHRFERGADFNAAPVANHLVSALILASGGQPDGSLLDILDPATEGRTASRPPISLSVKEVQRHLGTTLDDTPSHSALTPGLVTRYLTALGCTLPPGSSEANLENATFSVSLPSWRLDLEREIDLIEEVARAYGYNRFANTLPTPRPVVAHASHAPEHAVRTRLLALGFSEAISSTFASAAESTLFAPEQAHVPLENPLSEEASNLRPSLLPGMLAMLANNLNRDVTSVRLFERGHIFTAPGRTPTHIEAVAETSSLALGLTGDSPPSPPLHDAAVAPIFELKGAIESLTSLFTLPGGPDTLTFTTANAPAWLEPGRSATARLGPHPFAYFGELSRAESSRRKLRQPVFLATIDLAHLYEFPLRRVTAHELSRFQAVERDFSFVFPDSTRWHTVASAIHALSIPELTRLYPVEVWRNPQKFPGVYSLLLRTLFQSPERTLGEAELTSFWSRIIDALTALGGTLRAP